MWGSLRGGPGGPTLGAPAGGCSRALASLPYRRRSGKGAGPPGTRRGAAATALNGQLPAWQVDGLLEDYAHYARGEAAEVSPAVRDITGREPRDLVEFARDHAQQFA